MITPIVSLKLASKEVPQSRQLALKVHKYVCVYIICNKYSWSATYKTKDSWLSKVYRERTDSAANRCKSYSCAAQNIRGYIMTLNKQRKPYLSKQRKSLLRPRYNIHFNWFKRRDAEKLQDIYYFHLVQQQWCRPGSLQHNQLYVVKSNDYNCKWFSISTAGRKYIDTEN